MCVCGGGGQNQDKKTSTDGAALHKLMHMHKCVHTYASVCACAHVCLDMPIFSTPNSSNRPPLLQNPQATAPHLTPPCLSLQGLSQKTAMRRGTVFHPCGGQSLWIHQPNLGPSPVGSHAQQVLFNSPEDGGL